MAAMGIVELQFAFYFSASFLKSSSSWSFREKWFKIDQRFQIRERLVLSHSPLRPRGGQGQTKVGINSIAAVQVTNSPLPLLCKHFKYIKDDDLHLTRGANGVKPFTKRRQDHRRLNPNQASYWLSVYFLLIVQLFSLTWLLLRISSKVLLGGLKLITLAHIPKILFYLYNQCRSSCQWLMLK
jgi:hypothetical protein